MKRSQANVSSSARSIGPTGIAWPNEIVAVLTMPPHLRQLGNSSRPRKLLLDDFELVPLAAIEASGIRGVAVQFDHLVGGHARILMEVIDVLRDHRRDGAAADQFGDSVMADIGLGTANIRVDGELPAP